MRNKNILLAGNWKMNHGPKDTAQFLDSLAVSPKANSQMRLYVPFVSLDTAVKTVESKKLPIQIGAQNIHFEKSGAFTGEISASMLKEIGITQALVGHSERRQYFGETNESVLKRTVGALTQGIEVLVCIGETLDQRNQNQTEKVIESQLTALLADDTCLQAFSKTLHIAYEPVWAIGTGVTATPAQAEEAHAFIRGLLTKKLGADQANATRILYGGSVTPANFKELLTCPNIDGGLVGGASVKVESWKQLWDLI
jgi:triosephosphate isomerase